MKPITSADNPRVKAAAKLRDARQRRKQGRTVIDGGREIARALQAGVALIEVFVCNEIGQGPESDELLGELGQRDVPCWRLSPDLFAKVAFGDRAQGLVAVAEPPQRTLADLPIAGDSPLVVVLEGIEKPGNVGAILRSADGAGATAVIVADAATDLYNPNCIRASLGTVFTLPVVAASSAETLAWLRRQAWQMVAARVDGEADYATVDLSRPTALILGSEADGLSEIWHAADVLPVSLPMRGSADSLNVSATAAVLLYEALRQRGATGKMNEPSFTSQKR